MSSLNDIIDLIIYPLQKLFILLGSVQIFGVSLLSLLAAALVLTVIFNFFIGSHSIGSGTVHNIESKIVERNKTHGNASE